MKKSGVAKQLAELATQIGGTHVLGPQPKASRLLREAQLRQRSEALLATLPPADHAKVIEDAKKQISASYLAGSGMGIPPVPPRWVKSRDQEAWKALDELLALSRQGKLNLPLSRSTPFSQESANTVSVSEIVR